MNETIINELRTIELFAEDLRAKCYRARKKLEGIHPPAPSSKKRKRLSDEQILQIVAQRKKANLRKSL